MRLRACTKKLFFKIFIVNIFTLQINVLLTTLLLRIVNQCNLRQGVLNLRRSKEESLTTEGRKRSRKDIEHRWSNFAV